MFGPLCPGTGSSPHRGDGGPAPCEAPAQDEHLAPTRREIRQHRAAVASVDPDPAFVERLHRQLEQALSGERSLAGQMQQVQPRRPG